MLKVEVGDMRTYGTRRPTFTQEEKTRGRTEIDFRRSQMTPGSIGRTRQCDNSTVPGTEDERSTLSGVVCVNREVWGGTTSDRERKEINQ